MPYIHLGEHTARRPKGATFTFDPGGPTIERDTLMCAHCQMHWVVEPGSRHKRGWCYRCQAPLCGKRRCMGKCVPWERELEQMEQRQQLRATVARNFGV